MISQLFLASRKGSNFQEVNKSQVEVIAFWVEVKSACKESSVQYIVNFVLRLPVMGK